ncbi:MAG: hypothetical protein H7837_03440 [Magnetococcus sp. MYC-9]
MEEHQVAQTRRHGNGLLDRLAMRATPNGLHTPVLHVRNRWSSLKPSAPLESSRNLNAVWPARAGA